MKYTIAIILSVALNCQSQVQSLSRTSMDSILLASSVIQDVQSSLRTEELPLNQAQLESKLGGVQYIQFIRAIRVFIKYEILDKGIRGVNEHAQALDTLIYGKRMSTIPTYYRRVQKGWIIYDKAYRVYI